MKQLLFITFLILTVFGAAFAQKLTEPKYLKDYISGEDPSELLLHWVIEPTEYYFKENPEGKAIVRICSSDEFSTAFVKSPLNPLSASSYNNHRLIIPDDKIFIARSSKCARKDGYVFLQFWFVPDKVTLDYEEIYPKNSISNEIFYVSEFDWKTDKRINSTETYPEFVENIKQFVNQLKNDSKTEGFIVHFSNNKRMKQNIEKVKETLRKENIDAARVKAARWMRLEYNKDVKLVPLIDNRFSYPILETLTISEENTAKKN